MARPNRWGGLEYHTTFSSGFWYGLPNPPWPQLADVCSVDQLLVSQHLAPHLEHLVDLACVQLRLPFLLRRRQELAHLQLQLAHLPLVECRRLAVAVAGCRGRQWQARILAAVDEEGREPVALRLGRFVDGFALLSQGGSQLHTSQVSIQ